MIKDVVLMHKEDFIAQIGKLVQTEKLTIFEAILELCKEHGLDPEDVAPLVKGSLKEKLKNELIQRNVLPNTNGNKIKGI